MNLKICLLSPNKDAYSETFIRYKYEELPGNIHWLYGGEFPNTTADGKSILPFRWRLLGNSLAFYLKRAPNDIYSDMFRRFPKKVRDKALYHYLKKERIQVVLAEFGMTGVAVMDVCKDLGIPIIVNFHGHDAYVHEILKGYKERYQELFENAAAIIVVSKDMERQLLSLGASYKKLHFIPYGIDTSIFSNGKPSQTPPLFLAVGRFVDKKAPHLTLLAFKKVLDRCPEARLTMIGDGPLLEASKLLVKACRMEDKVEFPGPLPHGEVATKMRRSRAFVQHSIVPSHGDSEGTPNAILEAGATGLPVVATRHGGILDAVIHGETGLLVEEGDIDGMADCMAKLANDPNFAGRLGKAARARICSEFSREDAIKRLWTVIEGAI